MNDNDGTRSPSPRATFYDMFDSPLSTKRERNSTPMHQRKSAPRLARTAPPLSRYYPRRNALQKPHLISFKESKNDGAPIRSPIYNPNLRQTYFEQCFTCERKLGEGSFGEVFSVYSKEDGRRYAIKRALETFRNTTDRNMKLREVQKHELLPAHTNLVGFVKAWEERARLYIQTELCETSLSAYCSNIHIVPEKEIWNFFIDLLMGVDHLHQHNLLHLDIKPENILLTDDKICKLGDFGLIFDLKNDSTCTAEEGDSKYLAPEMLNSGPSKAADIFSLGITILEISTDMDLPSRGLGWQQLRNGGIPNRFFEGMSPDLRRLILWMLSPDPNLRPTTDQLLMDQAVVSRKSTRTVELHIHELKSSMSYHLYTVWMWLLAVFWLLSSVCRWTYEALKRTKDEVCHTPMKTSLFGNDDRRLLRNEFEQRTPETATPEFGRRPELDWSFSDEEGLPQEYRQACTVAAVGRRRPANASPYAEDPVFKLRLNFDNENEDTPTSSSDPSDSPTGVPLLAAGMSPPISHREKTESPLPSVASPYRAPITRRSGSLAPSSASKTMNSSVLGSGDCDWLKRPSRHDGDDSDMDELEVDQERYATGRLTCPPRLPLRTQYRQRAGLRPPPRLNFDLLDSPERPAQSSQVPMSAPSVKERRRLTRLTNRKIMANDSSADEW